MDVSDAAAVEKWLATRDAEAFQTISLRYSGMVFSTCKRILGNPIDAEDATQECFETLCCTTRIPAGYLGPWLHRVATNRCLKRLKSEQRRRVREHEHTVRLDNTEQTMWDDLYEFVDEAIAALPEKHRAPIIAHFFENRTHAEIAETLGVSRQTVTYRLTTGIERLRSALARRGIQVAAPAFAAMLAGATRADAVPPSLNATLAKLALAGTRPAVLSGGMISTILGALHAKSMLIALAMTAIIVMGGLFWSTLRQANGPHGERAAALPLRLAPAHAAPGTSTSDAFPATMEARSAGPKQLKPDGQTIFPTYSFGGVVYSPRGELLAGAAIDAFDTGFDKKPTSFTYTTTIVGKAWHAHPRHWHTVTDAKGRYSFHDIDSGGLVAVMARDGAYAGCAQVQLGSATPRPDVNIALKETGRLTARVLDPGGVPVAGALIEVLQVFSPGESGSDHTDWTYACTDAQGVFQLGVGVPGKTGLAALAVTAPGYPQASFGNVSVGASALVDLKLDAPASVSGRVTWHESVTHRTNRVTLECDARITHESASLGALAQSYETDIATDGTFRFDAVAPAEGYVISVCQTPPFCSKRDLGALLPGEHRECSIDVNEGATLQGHVYTNDKKPVAGVVVRVQREDGGDRPNMITGNDGAYKFCVSSPGIYRLTTVYSLPKGDDTLSEERVECEDGGEYEVDLCVPAPFSMPIRVVDEAGNPLSDVSLGMLEDASDSTTYILDELGRTDSEGRYLCRTYSPYPHSFTARKPGYASNGSPRVSGRPGEQLPELTILLYPSGGIEAVAVDEQGAPIAWAPIELHAACPGCCDVNRQTHSEEDGTFVFPEDIPATGLHVQVTATLGEEDDETEWSAAEVPVRVIPGMIVNAGEIVLKTSESDQ